MKANVLFRSICVVALLYSAIFAPIVDGFFFDKLERLKKLAFPSLASSSSAFGGLSFPGLSSGVRVCINFSSTQNYPTGYQQNTCFLCDSYRFNQIATYCTGQTSIPANINYTQANCIMNSCQPLSSGSSGLSSGMGTLGQNRFASTFLN